LCGTKKKGKKEKGKKVERGFDLLSFLLASGWLVSASVESERRKGKEKGED